MKKFFLIILLTFYSNCLFAFDLQKAKALGTPLKGHTMVVCVDQMGTIIQRTIV